MKAETVIIHQNFEKETFSQLKEEELEEKLKQYPYLAHLHWMEAKMWKNDKAILRKAGLYTYYPLLLESYLKDVAGDQNVVSKEEHSDQEKPLFQPLYTEDYFAYTRTHLPEHIENDKPPTMDQVRSFTGWLRMMKKQPESESQNEGEEVFSTEDKASESSTKGANVITESMADIWIKNGQPERAIAIYEKLILLNPEKRSYFADKISALKEQ